MYFMTGTPERLNRKCFFYWEKMINFTAILGEINDIEHNKGSKIYMHPQNQVILDCNMSSIPLKHKCLSIILIWVTVSHSHK